MVSKSRHKELTKRRQQTEISFSHFPTLNRRLPAWIINASRSEQRKLLRHSTNCCCCCCCWCPLRSRCRSFSSVKLKIHANCKQRQHIEILKNSANLRRELRIALEDIGGLLYINQIPIAKRNEKDVGGEGEPVVFMPHSGSNLGPRRKEDSAVRCGWFYPRRKRTTKSFACI